MAPAEAYTTPVDVQVADTLRTAIQEGKVEVHNAMALVGFGMQVVEAFKVPGSEKAQYVMKALETLAKGPDGEWGTKDDLLPPIVWNGVKSLIETGLIQCAIDTLHMMKNGTFPKLDQEQVKAVATGCFSFCMKKC